MRRALLLLLGLTGCFVDNGPDQGGGSSSGGADSSSTAPTTGDPGSCGDGVRDGDELCDDGPLNTPYGACGPLCLPNFCGDGHPGPADACDDGNKIDDDACPNDCRAPTCGDGIVQADEGCDDGNDDEDDACTSVCQPPRCGDGVVSQGETCDLGGDNRDDGQCTTACVTAYCGDGIVQVGEACEAPAASCDALTCRWTTCDGVMTDPHEACDGRGELCTDFCTMPRCGDGHVTAGEGCDDGNGLDGDNCTPACQPSLCGDGLVASDEPCDDPPGLLGGCDRECERNAYFVFVTSETYRAGEFGGLQGADDACTGLAAKAGLPGSYRAWLSDASTSPATRFSKSARPYILPPGPGGVGLRVAQSWADLVDGALERPISVTEAGEAIVAAPSCSAAEGLAWTRTDPTAGPLADAADCDAWGLDADGVGAAGQLHSATATWSAGCAEVDCASALHLYCFEQP